MAEARVPLGTKVQNVGRIDDGELSYTGTFVGPEVAVQDGKLMSKDCAATGRSCSWVDADDVDECL